MIEILNQPIPCQIETVGGVSAMKIGERIVPTETNMGDEAVLENIRNNAQRPLPLFQPAIARHDGHMVVVGSGPSVAKYVEQIKAEQALGRPVMAIKGAHDWLIEHGITPDLWTAMDAQPKILGNVKHKSKRVGYLVASKVDPSVFDWLSDQQVVMWHPWCGIGEEAILPPDIMRIGGGTTSGLRGIVLGYLMGFRKFILYGFDSCLSGKELRVGGQMSDEEVHYLQVDKGGKKWPVNGAMASQAMEFSTIFQFLGGIQFRVFGEGPIADIVADREKRAIGGYF